MDLPIVYLNKATFRDQSIIKIIFKNNKQIHTIIKESEWIAFNQECGTWTLPYSEKNININCISPGFIKTAMTDKIDEKFKEAIISKIPSARLGEPDDIANAVLFLASNQSDYINGETLHVNGGMYMAWQNKFLNY